MGNSSFEIVAGPLPTTDIFAWVAGERTLVNAQKIQVRRAGTETKNFLYYSRENVKYSKEPAGERWTYEQFWVVVREDLACLTGCQFGVGVTTTCDAHAGVVWHRVRPRSF